MYTEIVCAVIAFCGVAASAFLSWKTAEYHAKKEIEKMMLGWAREDVVTSDEEFADMAASCARYASFNNTTNRRDAASRVAAVRTRESGDLAAALDELYSALSKCGDIDSALTKVIDIKRKKQGEHQPKDHEAVL